LNAGQLKLRIAEASATAITARQAIEEGKTVDLKALEAHVEETCRAIVGLPGDQGQTLQPSLLALTDDLNLLADSLGREHNAMKTALGDLSSRHQAQNAYLKSPGGR
jgi:hypothetical protein